jgi:acetylornithine deacetylase/succinyl-diaminopimelate desuccinylase-like protein
VKPWRAILAAIRSGLPELEAGGVTFAAAWVANLATPAVLVVPVRRYVVQPCDVRYELALQVVAPLQSDDDDVVHELLELVLAQLPAGVTVGETTYGQDDRAGGTYVVSTTTLTA